MTAYEFNPGARIHHEYLKGTADIIDVASDTVTYLGFFRQGNANEATATASICRIQTAGTITRIMWANGSFMFNNIWNNRASLTYAYKNF
jgi:hypothetical protein